MVNPRHLWYFSNMTQSLRIPAFTLFGESSPFPDIIHVEAFSARLPLHDWHITPHRHEQMVQIIVVARGRVVAKTDGSTWHLSDSQFLFVPALCVHELQFEPDTEGTVISVPLPILGAIGPDGGTVQAALDRPLVGKMSDTLHALLKGLEASYVTSGAFRTQQLAALSQSLLITLAATSEDNHATAIAQNRLKALDGLIAAHREEGWSASDYARALSMSTGHLSRLCRAASGQGASAYIEQKVMQEACRLLAFTGLPVAEIGFRLGYTDPSYFSKRFSKLSGVAPSAYRSRFAAA